MEGRKSELKVLWPFYSEAFIGTLLIIAIPFMVIYFSSIGLNIAQIGLLLALGPLASLIFEIPTGAVADLYGRKFSVTLGWFLEGILFILLFFTSNYYYLIIILFLSGAATTLSTGSYEAWVVDLLRAKKMKNLIPNYFAKRQSLYNLAFIFSGILGALLVAAFGLKIIWIVSGISFIISAFFVYLGEEIYEKQKIHIKESFNQLWKQTKKSFTYGYKHHVLYYLLLITLIFGFVSSFDSFISWTPFLKNFNFPDYGFGYLWSATGILGVFAPILARKLLKKNKEKRLLISVSILTLIYGFLVLISNNLIFVVSVFLFGFFLSDFEAPIGGIYFHRFTPTKQRATIGSVKSMLYSLTLIISLPLAGFLIDKIGARFVIFIAALFMIPTLILYQKIKEKK